MHAKVRIGKHLGGALVAAGILAASLAEGAFEPTAYGAASIILWAVVIAGLVGRVLPGAPVAATAAAAGASLAALLLLAAASVAWASDQGRAFEEAVRISAYLGLFVLAACTARAGERREWLGGLTVGLGAVSVVAVVGHLQPGLLNGDELDQLIPGAAGRASYPVGYWNGLAALLALAAVLLAHSGAWAPARGARAVAVGLLPVALLGIWLTSSRGGAVAVLAGLAVLLAASPDRSRQLLGLLVGAIAGASLIFAAELMGGLGAEAADPARLTDGDRMTALAIATTALAGLVALRLDGRRPRLSLARPAAIAVVAVAAVVALAVIVAADPIERFDEFRAPPQELAEPGSADVSEDVNSSGRWQFWTEGVDAWEEAPLAGIGAGAYEDWWTQNATLAVFVRNPHSLPLQGLAELGLLGGLLLAGFAAAISVAALRWLRSGRSREVSAADSDPDREGADTGVLVAVLVAAVLPALVDWTWAIPGVAAPAVIAAGLLTASAPGRTLGSGSHWIGMGTLVLAWLAVVAGGLVVLTELKLDQSRDAAAAGRFDEGIERAEEARTVQPWSPEPYTQLALLEEARGDLNAAIARLAQACERDSEDWRLALIEARLQRGRGDEDAAQTALERARELSPLLPIFEASGRTPD